MDSLKNWMVETANIMLCFSRNLHLEIIRQRERNLNYDVSVDSFWKNYNEVSKPIEKISEGDTDGNNSNARNS